MIMLFPQMIGWLPGRLHGLGQHRHRRHAKQPPHLTIRPGHGHGADACRVARTTEEQLAIQNQPAADEIAEVEIQEILGPVSGAKNQFSPAGRGGIVLHINRQTRHGCQFGLNVTVAPGVHFRLRRTDKLHPIPKLKRHRHAHAADPVPVLRCQSRGDGWHGARDEGHNRIGGRIAVHLPLRCQNPAHEIHQCQISRPPPNL